jgi:hypothetical protein
LRDCCVARLRDCCVAILRDCCVGRLRDCCVARLRDCCVELTPSEDAKKNKFRCVLYGHHDLELADGLSLQKTRCFRMLAAQSAGHAGQPAGKLKQNIVLHGCTVA